MGFVNPDRVFREALRQGSTGKAGGRVRPPREGPERPGRGAQGGLGQVRARGAHADRAAARAAPEGADRPGPRVPAQAPRIPGRPERPQERRVAAGLRARQPRGQAGGGGRKVRCDPAGSDLHQPQARHHRKGDQGAERRHRASNTPAQGALGCPCGYSASKARIRLASKPSGASCTATRSCASRASRRSNPRRPRRSPS